MNKRYEESPRFNPTGLATGSIVALIVATVISVVFDIQPAEASNGTNVAHTSVAAR